MFEDFKWKRSAEEENTNVDDNNTDYQEDFEEISEESEEEVFVDNLEEAPFDEAEAFEESPEEEEEGEEFDEGVIEEEEPEESEEEEEEEEEEETDFYEEEAVEQVSSALTVKDDAVISQLSFDEKVLEKIIAVAIHEMDGVLLSGGGGGFFNFKSSKGIKITVDEAEQVSLDLDIIIEYGKSAPEIFEQLKILLSERLKRMTGLTVKHVNVRVANVLTSQEFQEKNS